MYFLSGGNIIHQICKEGRAELLEDVLKVTKLASCNLQDILGAKDLESGYTPLHDAIYYGNMGCALKLIKYGALLSTVDADNLTPLDIAVWNQYRHRYIDPYRNRWRKFEFEPYRCDLLTWGWDINLNLGHHDEGKDEVRNWIDRFKLASQPKKVAQFIINGHYLTFKPTICSVEFGTYHTLFLDSSGYVYACGSSEGGRLGLGYEDTVKVPTLIPNLKNVVKVSCSRDHSLALTSDGEVYSWGTNTHRVLGHCSVSFGSFNKCDEIYPIPTRVEYSFLNGESVVDVKTATYHSVLVTEHSMYTFGFDGGQMGVKYEKEFHPGYEINPREAERLMYCSGSCGKIVHVCACTAATVVGFEDGSVYVCYQFQVIKVGYEYNGSGIDPFGLRSRLKYVYYNEYFSMPKKEYLSFESKKIQVCGGRLHTKPPERNGHENICHVFRDNLLITFLDSNGNVVMLCLIKGDIKFVPITFSAVPEEKLLFSDIAMGTNVLFLLAKNGELFRWEPEPLFDYHHDHSYPQRLLRVGQLSLPLQSQKETVTQVKEIHNGLRVFCNETSSSVACLVQDRTPTWDIKAKYSTFSEDISSLYDNSEVYPSDFTIILQTGRSISVHKAIISNFSERMREKAKCRRSVKFTKDDPSILKMLEKAYHKDSDQQLKRIFIWKRAEKGTFNRGVIKDFADVALISKHKTKFLCHRVILAARIPYFRTLFRYNTEWCTGKSRIFVNANDTVLESFINYVYTDQFPKNLTFRNARDLLILSDRYLDDGLKSYCEYKLSTYAEHIKETPAIFKVLKIANMYNAQNLRDFYLDLVALNMPSYIKKGLLDELEEDLVGQIEEAYKRDIQESNYKYNRRCYERRRNYDSLSNLTCLITNNATKDEVKPAEKGSRGWILMGDGPIASNQKFTEMLVEEEEIRMDLAKRKKKFNFLRPHYPQMF